MIKFSNANPPKDLAELLNAINQNMLEQGKGSTRSTSDEDPTKRVCVYRGENNTACAIGSVITDEDYNPAMDDLHKGGENAETIARNYESCKWMRPYIDTLRLTQLLHDGAAMRGDFIATWKSQYDSLAE